jgi:hypothetical protein
VLPVSGEEKVTELLAALEASVAAAKEARRASASQSSTVAAMTTDERPWTDDRSPSDAPVWLDAEAAAGWCEGWNAAVQAAAGTLADLEAREAEVRQLRELLRRTEADRDARGIGHVPALRDEEAGFLRGSGRCSRCPHLGAFHTWTDFSEALVCELCECRVDSPKPEVDGNTARAILRKLRAAKELTVDSGVSLTDDELAWLTKEGLA